MKSNKDLGVSTTFQPSLKLSEIKKHFFSQKLSLQDRIILATNLGAIFKDAIRMHTDFTMRRLFIEAFDNEDAAESAYKKRHTFIWMGDDNLKRDPKELKSKGRHYVQFLHSLEEKTHFSKSITKENRSDTLFKMLISRTSFDNRGAQRDLQNIAFRSEIDLRFSQIIGRLKETVDVNWWYEWIEKANLPNSTLSVRGPAHNQAAPKVKLASVSSKVSDLHYGSGADPIIGVNEISVFLDQDALSSDLILSFTIQRAICAKVFSDRPHSSNLNTLLYACGNIHKSTAARGLRSRYRKSDYANIIKHGYIPTANAIVPNEIEKAFSAIEPEQEDFLFSPINKRSPSFTSGELSADLRTIDIEHVSSEEMMDEDLFELNIELSIDGVDDATTLNDSDSESLAAWLNSGFYKSEPRFFLTQSSHLNLEIRFDENENIWKPVIVWDFPDSTASIVDQWASKNSSLIPIFSFRGSSWDMSTISSSTFRSYAYIWDRDREGYYDIQIITLETNEDGAPKGIRRGILPNSCEQVFFPSDPDFYTLLFEQQNSDPFFPGYNLFNGHSIFVEETEDAQGHTGAIAPGGSLASAILENLAFASEEKRFDQLLLEDARQKFDAHRKQFLEKRNEYLQSINKNLGSN